MGECGQRVKKETEIGLGDEGVNVESNKTKNQTVSSKRIKQVKSHQDHANSSQAFEIKNGKRRILEPNREKHKAEAETRLSRSH